VKLTKQKNFRVTAAEDKGVTEAARDAGFTDSEWLRMIVRVALGETALLKQLQRVSNARVATKKASPVRKPRRPRTKA
jgi:hypothetical protein